MTPEENPAERRKLRRIIRSFDRKSEDRFEKALDYIEGELQKVQELHRSATKKLSVYNDNITKIVTSGLMSEPRDWGYSDYVNKTKQIEELEQRSKKLKEQGGETVEEEKQIADLKRLRSNTNYAENLEGQEVVKKNIIKYEKRISQLNSIKEELEKRKKESGG